jgi:pSer/pThr/pTyr-binding forkhead associated (FHA) protein
MNDSLLNATPQNEAFWVEVLDKHGDVASRTKVHARGFTVGRAYGNDCVVDDPYVSPVHLRIFRDEQGALWIEDLATDNGTVDLKTHQAAARVEVIDEGTVRIGHTRIRVRTATFAVPPTLSIASHVTPVVRKYGRAALLAMVAFIVWTVVSIWLTQTGETKFSNYAAGTIFFPMVAFFWAGSWALVTRIVSTQGQFFRHVLIVFFFLLIGGVVTLAFKYLDFALAWVNLNKWEAIFSWLLLGGICFAHLCVVTPKHVRVAGIIVTTLVVAAIAVDFSLRAERQRTQTPRIATTLMPPFLPYKSPATTDKFFKAAQALKPELDEERKKEPPAGAMFFSDGD